jgi:acyl-CoA synthetase (AMP-forming)/AMP-acid ligase II
MEKAYAGSTDGKPAYGQRVFVNLVDEIATCDPSRTLIAIPRSTDPNEGWQDLTFGQYANAVNRLSHWIVEQVGVAIEGEYPTMAYIGPNDVRYLIILAAAVKAGYKVCNSIMPIHPWNMASIRPSVAMEELS